MKKHHWYAFRHKHYLKSNRYHTAKYIYVTHTKEINMQDRGS